MALHLSALASGAATMVVSRARAQTMQRVSKYVVDSYTNKSTHPFKGLSLEGGQLRTFEALPGWFDCIFQAAH